MFRCIKRLPVFAGDTARPGRKLPSIHVGYREIISLKAKIKHITRRNTGHNLAGIIRELNPVARGVVNYFRIANCRRELAKLMGWIRRRLRCIQLKHWKKPAKLHRRLKQLGYQSPFKHIKMTSWRNTSSPLASFAMPNRWFHDDMQLVDMASTTVGITVSDP